MLATKNLTASATTWTQIYVSPAAVAGVNPIGRTIGELNACNTNTGSDALFDLAITTTSSSPGTGTQPGVNDTVSIQTFGRTIGKSGVAGNGEYTKSLGMKAGQYLWARSSVAGVSVTIQGVEE